MKKLEELIYSTISKGTTSKGQPKIKVFYNKKIYYLVAYTFSVDLRSIRDNNGIPEYAEYQIYGYAKLKCKKGNEISVRPKDIYVIDPDNPVEGILYGEG